MLKRQAEDYKSQLTEKFWLPKVQKYAKLLRPRLRDKHLKILTLTSDDNYCETLRFIEHRLTSKDEIFLWTYDHHKRMRLEAERFQVLPTAKYEDTIINSSQVISSHFPFEILNLDFFAQDPTTEEGRVELEIESVEATVRLQKMKQTESLKGFVTIYTTLFDGNAVDVGKLANRLNSYHVDGWAGIDGSAYPGSVKTMKEKVNVIERLLADISKKYGYEVAGCNHVTPTEIISIVMAVRKLG